MSERLTAAWTPGLKEVFGMLGEMGEIGELHALELFTSLNIKCRYNPADKVKQCGGLDIEIWKDGEWVGVDVKANIHSDDNKKVCVDYPKLKKSEAKYWIHINSDDYMNDFIIYPVKSMIELARACPAVGKDMVRWVWKDEATNLK